MGMQKKRMVLVLIVGAFIISFGAGCQHTYEVTKKDGVKEHIKASYYTTNGSYAHFYIAFQGLVKTVQANEIRRATDKEIKELELKAK